MSKVHINIELFLFLFISMVSCKQMEEDKTISTIETTLCGTIGLETKTQLVNEGEITSKVVWEKNDEIAVFIDDNRLPKRYTLVSGENTTKGVFSGNGVGKQYLSIYPYSAVKEAISGEEVMIEFPVEQKNGFSSFGSGANPMVAISHTTDLTFHNVCSLIKLSIRGRNVVNKIVFSANDEDVFVAGPAKIRLDQNGIPEVQMEEGGHNSVTLITDGLELNADTYTDFYLTLPPQKYVGGFTVTIYTPTGYMRKSIEHDFVLERSKIHSATPFNLHLDEGVNPSSYLRGLGTDGNPFLIESLADLLYMRQKVNREDIGMIEAEDGSLVTAMTAYYKLTSDIDLSSVCGESIGADWEPIGDAGANIYYVFGGVFDGNNHCITNLYINNTKDFQGLFGACTPYMLYPNGEKSGLIHQSKGVIKNLSVKGRVQANNYVALIASTAFGVENCKTYGTVKGKICAGIASAVPYYSLDSAHVQDCDNYADVEQIGENGSAAGIVYYWQGASSHVSNCRNYGNIKGEGGIGVFITNIDNCINYGKVRGVGRAYGIAAHAYSVVNCMNYGEIIGEGSYSSYFGIYSSGAGGLIGGGIVNFIKNCVNAGKVTAIDVSCGIYNGIYGDSSYEYCVVANCLNVGTLGLSDMGYPTGNENINSGCVSIGYYSSNVRLSNNYWLYDEERGIGNKEGVASMSPSVTNVVVENNKSLTAEQIKGIDDNLVLYVSQSGGAYTNLVKALNAWAYEHSIVDGVEYSGWTLSQENGYPTLTMQEAIMPEPDEVSPFLELETTSVNAAAEGEHFSINVSTNMAFEITTDDEWVLEVGREKTGFFQTSISFYAKPNPSSQERECNINIKTGTEEIYSVKVIQQPHPEWYISLDYSKDGVVKVLRTASKGNGIDIVLMGDGFSDRQIEDQTYASIMYSMERAFFAVEPYKSYQDLFNVYYVNVVSTTEGYEHAGQRLGTKFGEGTHIEGDDAMVLTYAKKAIDDERMDDAVIIVALNSNRYAGTCRMLAPDYGDSDWVPNYGGGTAIAYCSKEDAGEEFTGTVQHEAGGHGFAKLADEYYYEEYGSIPASEVQSAKVGERYGWYKNIDFTNNPSGIKWKSFLEDARYDNDGLGVFEGAMTYPFGVYRPTENSIMRSTNFGEFNAPSRYAIWYRIGKLAHGDEWSGTYEDFVTYDVVNRIATTGTKAVKTNMNLVERRFQPLAPPEVVNRSWREVVRQ